MSIEGITLENFIAPKHTEISGTTQVSTHHAVFHSFWSDERKQDYATTNAHRKRIIELLKQRNIM